MKMRLIFAIPEGDALHLMRTLLASALQLNPLAVEVAEVSTLDDLMARVEADTDDIVLLDWLLADARTPEVVAEILARNPKLRVVALLPLAYRQYRHQVWCAGACNGIPKEYMDQEWLSTVLCLMHRAMEREARILKTAREGHGLTRMLTDSHG
ncbi:MAG: response regulator transcription factor [Chloroflexi bacterium]|nr:response regulator transcription factor [Chloroflexota bacterium]